jgi:uncharacterized protein YjbJ (UPF0337 family)
MMRIGRNRRKTLSRAPAQTGTAFKNIFYRKETNELNKDILEGKWKQMRGEAKGWWGKLTDDDLDKANGKYDVLTGIIQEKYGYTREAAEEEIEKRVALFEAKLKE